MKTCSACRKEKVITEFGRNKSRKDGLQHQCKLCVKAKNKEYFLNNREAHYERSRRWQEKNPEKTRQKQKRWTSRPHPKFPIASGRVRSIKSVYNISVESFMLMLVLQKYRCRICEDPIGVGACVDHDHSCCPVGSSCGDCVRGLLCHRCNFVIGKAEDSIFILSNAIKYLGGK